ncbi:MAG: DinB family protein [Pseudomonadota bacterium]
MITPDWVRMMARYTAWQNQSICSAANALPNADRQAPRGAFFGSIEGTLNHLLWGDRMWMSRFAGTPKPSAPSIAESVNEVPEWPQFLMARAEMDQMIAAWAASVTEEDLAGDLTWYSGAAGREVSKPMAFLVTHFFNHATHHRGQVHAMLTASGARPDDTDLFLMP